MKKVFPLLILFCVFAFSISAQEAQKVDDWGPLTCEEYLKRMDGLSSSVKENPSAKVYVLVYEGRESQYSFRKGKTEFVFPAFGLAKAKIRSMKQFLELNKFTPINQFVFIEAGFREDLTVEAWLVPNGATPPKSTPTLTKMRYRKGKAKGFCLGCC